MKNVQAQFQMLDSYVKEYNLKTKEKILKQDDLNVKGKIGFCIINISEEESLIGEIELTNDLDILVKNQIKAQIRIVMRGLFKYADKNEKEKFETMLKINGAATLSNLMRAYIHTNTALSGMPNIIIPMINFVEFFKNVEKQ